MFDPMGLISPFTVRANPFPRAVEERIRMG